MPQSSVTPEAGVLERLLASRHSCRSFRSTPIPRKTIEQILSMAQRTASWCNTQPWHVHLVSGDKLDEFGVRYVQRMRTSFDPAPDLEFPLAYRGQYLERRRECGFALYSSLGIGREDKQRAHTQTLENFRFFGAPHLAVISTERDLGAYGGVDCGGYISVFLLAAASLGVAAVPQAALATDSEFVREFLAIPIGRQVVAGISFGIECVEHPANGFRTGRAAIEDSVTWLD